MTRLSVRKGAICQTVLEWDTSVCSFTLITVGDLRLPYSVSYICLFIRVLEHCVKTPGREAYD